MSKRKLFFRLSIAALVIAIGLTAYEAILREKNEAVFQIWIFDLSAIMFLVTFTLLAMTSLYEKDDNSN